MVAKKKPEETVVLITGASTGIGRLTAGLLTEKGYRVYGTSRKPAADGTPYTMLQMDVTDPASVRRAVATVLDKEKIIDVLVNNAGSGIGSAIEETDAPKARQQFEVVLWGVWEVTKQVLPAMRQQQHGLVINISSIAGRMGLPYQGFYSAAKFALEGLSEALSLEVKPFGIKLVLVEPGDMRTEFTSRREWLIPENQDSPYRKQIENTREIIDNNELKGGDPTKVSRKIYHIIKKKNPRFRYVVGKPDEKAGLWLKELLPYRWFMHILAHFYGIK